MKHFDTSDRFSNHFKFFGPDFEQLGSSSQTNETIRYQIYSILTQNLILYVRCGGELSSAKNFFNFV